MDVEVSPLTNVFKRVEEADVRLLVGNGIHIPVFAAWFAYVMGNTIRREHPHVPRPLAPASEDCEIADESSPLSSPAFASS